MIIKKYKHISLLLIALNLVFLSSCSDDVENNSQIPQVVKIVTIKPSTDIKVQKFSAVTEAFEKSQLSFRVNGLISNIFVTKGEVVKAGDLLAELDPTDFELKVAEIKASRDRSLAQYKRNKELVKENFITEAELELTEFLYKSSEAQLLLAKKNLEYTKLYSPISGIIANIYLEPFEYVLAGMPIMKVQDEKKMFLTVSLPEDALINIKSKNILKITGVFDTYKGDDIQKKTYTIKYFKHVAEAEQLTQTYKAYFVFPTPKDHMILPGMTASVYINYNINTITDNQFIVPEDAILRDSQKNSYIWKVNDDQTITKNIVLIGEMTDQGIEIISGVTTGMRLVVAGAKFLKEGDLVTPFIFTYNQ